MNAPADVYTPLVDVFGDSLLQGEPLARYTAARLGGPADALLVVHSVVELLQAVQLAWKHHWKYRILGGGANVLPSDEGFRGLVIINRAAAVIIQDDAVVTAESGANLSTLARRCISRGLSGLAWAVSVPGTVGGAAINNAGAHGSDMAASVREVRLNTPAGEVVWPLAKLEYGYRASALKTLEQPFVLTHVVLTLTSGGDPAALKAEAETYVAHRKRTQPPGASLGSMFKNPPGDYAGRLIEAAGLKGERIGGVQISPVHANFFINLGDGTAADYRALIALAQRTVAEQFNVTLELEIELI